MNEPHGGNLVDRVINDNQEEQLRDSLVGKPRIQLDPGTYQDFINIANGRYSPIKGFLNQTDFLKVVHDMSLEDGTIWPLPIILDVSADIATEIVPGENIGVKSPDGSLVGAIDVSEVYKYNAEETARHVFGTTDKSHPGVQTLYDKGEFLVGGTVYMFDRTRYNDSDLIPKETRVLFAQNNWETIAGFQTRNAPHRAHEYIQKSALEHVDGLLIQPKLGKKKDGDYTDEAILGAYKRLLDEYYSEGRYALTVFPSRMNYAGPREALFDALVRKNHGCTHFIVGRDHAGVEDYYDSYDAQEIFDEVKNIGIEPLFYNYSFFCQECDQMTSEKICPHDESAQVHPSGTKIRHLITEGKTPSEKMMHPEVASYLLDSTDPFISGTKTINS